MSLRLVPLLVPLLALPLLVIAACSTPFDEDDDGTKDGNTEDGGGDDGGGWWEDGGGSDGGGSDGGWSTEPSGDADNDGFTIEEGDCDDGDRSVHPGADDSVCDGQDNDCDEEIDEDFDRDSYEPNDSSGYDLGKIPDESDEVLLAWLWPEDDQDRFVFFVEDGSFSWFDIEVWLYDVPSDADYALELWMIEDSDGDYIGLVDSADEESDGGEELINYGGSSGFDDTGWYEVVVYSTDGARCDVPYTLQLLVGSWR